MTKNWVKISCAHILMNLRIFSFNGIKYQILFFLKTYQKSLNLFKFVQNNILVLYVYMKEKKL